MASRFLRGTSVRTVDAVTNYADTAITPSSIQITIYDPNGRAVVSGASMTSTGTTGEYAYSHQTSETDPIGVYRVVVAAQSGSDVGRKLGSFELYPAIE